MTIEALTYIFLGLVALIAGGELLVRGAVGLANLVKIPPLVIGLTVVAFGTSSPELAVSIRSVISGNTGISVGNILGSNIYNILLVLGVAALLKPLKACNQLIRFDVPIMILASAMTLLLSLDGVLTRMDGAGLFLSLCGYTVWQFKKGKKEQLLLHALKYNDKKEIGYFFGNKIVTLLLQTNKFKDVDAFIPVPLHYKKQFNRGYNQSKSIAEGISYIFKM